MFQYGYDAGHMGGNGTEALLNTLFIPDIRKNFRKDRKLWTVKGGNMKSGLTHQGK